MMDQTTTKTKVEVLKPFKELFNPDWRYLVFYGGRASGKSQAVAQSLLIRGRAKKLRILCTREVQNTIKDSVHKLLSDLIEKYGFGEYAIQRDTIVNLLTGTEFLFKGLRHNINEIKSTEGIDVCWVEEAQSITQASMDILTPTIRKPGSQIIYTFNRFNELDPVYVRYVMNTPPGTYQRKVNFDVLEKRWAAA
jgi:phage terminase large subunit